MAPDIAPQFRRNSHADARENMMDQATYWLSAIVVSTLAFLVSVATYLRTGDWKRSEAGKEVEAKISGLDTRLTVVETNLEHLPSKSDVATLTAEVEALQDDVGIIRGGVRRIEDYLLEARK
jgi:hypothetical protein